MVKITIVMVTKRNRNYEQGGQNILALNLLTFQLP